MKQILTKLILMKQILMSLFCMASPLPGMAENTDTKQCLTADATQCLTADATQCLTADATQCLTADATQCLTADTIAGQAQNMQTQSEQTQALPQQKKSLLTKLLDYFNDANKNKNHKRFDFSVIGGPHYASDTKLGLGLVAAGLYRADPNDTILPPSNVSLFGDVSTVGFYLLGIRGTHLFPQNKYRAEYTVYFYSFPCKFWGMGYDQGNDDDNESDMKRWQARVKGSFLFHLSDHLFLGPMFAYDYVIGKDIDRPELLCGMDRHTWNLGAGFSLVYDSRDVLTFPHRGVYLNLTQTFRPRFMGNDYAFSTTELQVDAYQRPWKGAILAEDLRTMLNFGNPSWGMMALLGSSNSMRGYYEGRYRDKHKIETQVELRQHIWKRNSLTVWVGAGTVFHKFSNLSFNHILPNYGLGYRWEFKKNVNVRLDYGFGKAGQSGFLFNINEAF